MVLLVQNVSLGAAADSDEQPDLRHKRTLTTGELQITLIDIRKLSVNQSFILAIWMEC